MYNLIALCGESACGKDTILKNIVKEMPEALHRKVSYTTREPREGERDGIDYFFISDSAFANKITAEEMLEATVYDDAVYGTGINSLREGKVNIGIFDLDGIESLRGRENVNLIPVYIETDERIRFHRKLDRDKHLSIDEIYQRYRVDRMEFDDVFSIPEMLHVRNNTEQDLKQTITILTLIIEELNKNI